MEIWKDIIGYEGYYQVSNLGNVRSLNYSNTGRISNLSPGNNRLGYLRVNLSKNGKTKTFPVHRLVAIAFPEICGEYFPGAEVNHKDENKHNNVASNLEICNSNYNHFYGTRIKRAGEKHRKKVAQYNLNGNLMALFDSIKTASKETGIASSTIGKVCRSSVQKSGEYSYHPHTAGGFRWEYA